MQDDPHQLDALNVICQILQAIIKLVRKSKIHINIFIDFKIFCEKDV